MKGRGNRLADEKSPYLRQHAENPVDWHPWSEEAFEKAESEDKPVFLSIGYSACHWCHVMERECFEDEEAARLMNETFVNVKVDREERPDLDNVYMTACMLMTGRGGWPLTVIMTPDKRPFFAGTYIPRESRPGMNGMLDLIPAIGEIWKNRREEVFKAAKQITSAMGRMGSSRGELPGENVLEAARGQLAEVFDQANGGFGDRPKFPSPHTLLLLLRLHHRDKDPAPLSMVTATLKAMRRGGVFDQLGYGFHRYSTDEKWLLPHFEKMLYDQGLMVLACAEAYRVTGDDSLKRIAEEVHEYVDSSMTDPDGAFFSAEDADSEGQEGKFYLWTMDQVRQALGDEDAELAARVFGLREEGNFHDEATGELTGANVLHLVKPLSFLAEEMRLPTERLEEDISRIRTRLLAARSRRERPLRDEKVLTDWNGLYIASLAYSARVFSRPDLSSRALRACDFILQRMRRDDGGLLHRYMEGSAGIDGFLDDYAYMLWALVELYQASLEPRLLTEAVALAERMIADFADPENGGFYFTASQGEELIHRYKEAMDGAMPSGNSTAAYGLARLARITGRSDFEDRALGVLKAFSGSLSKSPANYCMLLSALDFVLGPSTEVALAGGRKDPGVRDFLAALNGRYLPRTVWVLASDETVEIAPFTSEMSALDGKPAAYVCENFACQAPVTEPEEMLKLLEGASGDQG